MAATIFTAAARDSVLPTKRALIVLAETNQLVTGPGFLSRLLVPAVGTSMTVDIYDATSGTTSPLWHYVTADGKVDLEFNMPFQNGLRVIVGGTPGEVSIGYRG